MGNGGRWDEGEEEVSCVRPRFLICLTRYIEVPTVEMECLKAEPVGGRKQRSSLWDFAVSVGHSRACVQHKSLKVRKGTWANGPCTLHAG